MRLSPHYGCPGIDPKKGGAGVIRAVYAREGKRWVKVGYICLTCRAFNPDRPFFPHYFGTPSQSP